MAHRVIYPRGLPETEVQQASCQALVRHCGGTGLILVAGRDETRSRLCERIANFLWRDDEPPLIVLTSPNPAAQIITVRKDLELAVPKLLRARWLVFVGMELPPSLIAEASELGVVEGSGVDGPLWLTRAGSFLLLAAELRRPVELPLRIEALDAASQLSRRRPAIGTSYSERPPPRFETLDSTEREPRQDVASASRCGCYPMQRSDVATGSESSSRPRSIRSPAWKPDTESVDLTADDHNAESMRSARSDYGDDEIPNSAVVRTTPTPGVESRAVRTSRGLGEDLTASRRASSGATKGQKLGSMRLAPRLWHPGLPADRKR